MNERTVVPPPGNPDPPAGEPFLRVERGSPDLDEIATLVAVLAALDTEAAAPSPVSTERSAWNDPAVLLRGPRHPRQRR